MEFRTMRRAKQALSPEECEAVLRAGTYGVLAVSGDGGYPYAVPLNYSWDGGRLLFHCARAGHKLDALRRDGKASFCVVARSEVVPERFATRYESVVVFGKLRELDGPAEKRAAIRQFAACLAPGEPPARRDAEIARDWDALCMLELRPESISGKRSRGDFPG